ncbi:unnamed protein product [Calicophoron daubneyi]|uniref:Telomeric repeat-binding factor 2-interacting protein 1 n=1 Tax=Calicophoron daubneyi TaxID=300641 RepID=A0AAV2TLW4_CALDB
MRSHFRRFYAKPMSLSEYSRRKRTEFTEEDDTAILDYLVSNDCYHITRIYSMDLWKDMESRGITAHSADSMRSRFRRCLTFRFIEMLPSNLKEVKRRRLTETILRPKPTHLTPGVHRAYDSFEFTVDEECESYYV